MQERVHESRRRGIARRVGAAGMALAALLGLAGCHEAYGGGYIGDPLDGGPIGVFNERCKIRLQLHQCDARGSRARSPTTTPSTEGPRSQGSGSTAPWTRS